MKRQVLACLAAAVGFVFAAGCGGEWCAHDVCGPSGEFDAVVAVPDTMATGDVIDAAGVDATRDGTVGDAVVDVPAGDVVADVGSDVAGLPYGLACRTCEIDAECNQGAACVVIGAEKHCVNECLDDGDCAKGLVCYDGAAAQNYCLPVSYDCVACIYDEPCPEGLCCDFNTGACKECGGDCSCCSYDFDCGEGFRCFKEDSYSAGMCVPECVDGACADADNYTCVENARGVEMCIPNTDGCPGCTSPTPWPLDCVCVECRDSSDCLGEEVCIEVGHTCAIVDCVAEDEIPCKHDGQCHECCDDSDCLRSGFTGVCLEDGTCQSDPDCQGLCTMDFPFCVWAQGIAQCVQCVDDYDCTLAGFPECSCIGEPLYSCMDDTGSICREEGPQCATCVDQDDCALAFDGAVMGCAQVAGEDYGLCIDTVGRCDGTSACCGPGTACYSLTAVLSEILGPARSTRIIAPPDGIYNFCACETSVDCLAGDPCTETAMICDGSQSALGDFYDLLCPEGQLDSRFPPKLCVQPAKLQEFFGITPM